MDGDSHYQAQNSSRKDQKSSSDWLNYTGFPGDVVFTTVTTSAYQDQLNAVFSKVCQIFNVHGFTHRSVIVVTFPQPET